MANKQLFANGAISNLVASVLSNATIIGLFPGDGALFPVLAPGSSDFFLVTIENPADGTNEICRCTSRNADLLTVVRAQEGMLARDFPVGAQVELRLTAATMNNFPQESAGEGQGIPDAPNNGIRHTRRNLDWNPEPAVGPANALTSNQVAAVQGSVNPSAGNPMATMADVIAAEGSGSLPAPIIEGLLAAINPSTGNPFVTVADIPPGGSGGTVLTQPQIDALNGSLATVPATDNPYVTQGQIPVTNQALAEVRLTVGALRALNNGSFTIPQVVAVHPVLGSLNVADLTTIFGTSISLPFSVSGIMVKEGKSAMLVLLQVDRKNNTFVSTAYVWNDDGTASGSDNINDPTNPKTHFQSTGQIVYEELVAADNNFQDLIDRVDQLMWEPEDFPVSAGNLRVSMLYEPFIQIEGFSAGANVFDGTSRYAKLIWKTSPEAAAIPPKEVVTVNGGVYGHLFDANGAFIAIERVRQWIAEGRVLQVSHNGADPNVANLTVLQVTPNVSSYYAQALDRLGGKGLKSVAASAVEEGAIFRDGASLTPGRFAYKEIGGAVKYPLFEGDILPVSGGGTSVVDTDVDPASPLQFALEHAGAITDLDLAAISTFNVNFDDTVVTPAGEALTAWFFSKNISGTKKVHFDINAAGTDPGAPGNRAAYGRSTGSNSSCLKSDPTVNNFQNLVPQSFTIPAGAQTSVLFVGFFNSRAISGVPAGTDFSKGINLGASSGGVGGTDHHWDHVYTPPSGMSPIIATYLHDFGDLGGSPLTLNVYPHMTDVDVSFFSNLHSLRIFAFIFSDTQIQGGVGETAQAFFQGAGAYPIAFANTTKNARAVYLCARRNRGASPGVLLTVTGATLDGAADLHTGSAFNLAEMQFLQAQEAAVVGSNAAEFDSALTNDASIFAFNLLPGDAPNLRIVGATDITDNNRLIPVIYNPVKGVVRICA